MPCLPEGAVRQEIGPNEQTLKTNNLCPGTMVSSDQFVSHLSDHLYTSACKEQEKDKFMGGLYLSTIFPE